MEGRRQADLMDTTREIYWNIGHGVVVPLYLFTVLAVSVCAAGFLMRIRVYRLGRPLGRVDHLWRRIRFMVRSTATQSRVLRVRGPGALHAVLFWSIGLLFIGTLLVMAQADVTDPLLELQFLRGSFYELFSFALDLAGFAALIALGGLLVRRIFVKPEGLDTTRDDYVVSALLVGILLTGFLVEGARMAATEIPANPALARFSPVGDVVAHLFLQQTPGELLWTHKFFWWIHFLLVMVFISLIPFTKLRHIVTVPANYFFADTAPTGTIITLDLEDDAVTQFGAATVSDLAWKDIFDADACTSCKRCQDRCPAWATEKPLSPMKVVKQVGELAFAEPDAALCERLTTDALWACTTCRACQDICPASIEHVNKIIAMRRNLTLMQGSLPGDEVRAALDDLEVNGNPFGLAYASRGDWAADLGVPTLAEADEVDALYFVGCYASFDERNKEVARSFVAICRAADIKIAVLGKDERCCGEPARKLGNEYLYQMLAQDNVKRILAAGVKRIVTTCPHCYNTLTRDYRDFGLTASVEHHAVLIAQLLEGGRLTAEAEELNATFHDSCYLARYMDIVKEPRAALALTGTRVIEMEKAGRDGFCCGGGGGRILAEEVLGRRINAERVRMARATGAPLVVSTCPFCLTMLEDGIKTTGDDSLLRARDLAEIVAERIRA